MLVKVCPFPQRVAKKIVKGDFVEMEELLPELWPASHQEWEEGQEKSEDNQYFHMDPMFRIILEHSSQTQPYNPELMAYMVSIVRVSREHSGLGWVQYNALFWNHTTLKEDTKWSIINTTLHARCFTGALREVVRCELCWATSYHTKDCSYLAGTDSTIEFRVQNM